jgi:hypothetical protein
MAASAQQIAEWLGAKPRNDFDLAQIVRRGLPLVCQRLGQPTLFSQIFVSLGV